jgi:hypothetical protein
MITLTLEINCLANSEGVTVYVLDSGIYTGHDDFEGRASSAANFITNEDDTDYAGHGIVDLALVAHRFMISIFSLIQFSKVHTLPVPLPVSNTE